MQPDGKLLSNLRRQKMPRDSSGNYTLPLGNPVIDGTVIDVNWANPTMQDIAAQLNNVITRDGLLGFTNPILAIDGTAAAPAYSFVSAPGSGMFRNGGALGFSVAGNLIAQITPAGLTLAAGKAFSADAARMGDGTALVPAYSFANDPSTGMYRNLPAGELGFSALGVERLRVHALGATIFGDMQATGSGRVGNVFVLNHTNLAADSGLYAVRNNVNRWAMRFGDATGEPGANAGSDFALFRADDAGAFNATPVWNILRSTGAITFSTPVTFTEPVTLTGGVAGGALAGNSLAIGTPVTALFTRAAANTLGIRIGDGPAGPFTNYFYTPNLFTAPEDIRATGSLLATGVGRTGLNPSLNALRLQGVGGGGMLMREDSPTALGYLSLFYNSANAQLTVSRDAPAAAYTYLFGVDGLFQAAKHYTPGGANVFSYLSANDVLFQSAAGVLGFMRLTAGLLSIGTTADRITITQAGAVNIVNSLSVAGVAVKKTYSGMSAPTPAGGIITVPFPAAMVNPIVVVSGRDFGGSSTVAVVVGVPTANNFTVGLTTLPGAPIVGGNVYWIAYEQ